MSNDSREKRGLKYLIPNNLFFLFLVVGLIILTAVIAGEVFVKEGDLTVNTGDNVISSKVINVTSYDSTMYFYGHNSLLDGSPSSGGIKFIQSRPEAKTGIWWNAFDHASARIRPSAWIVAHYNSSSAGVPHQHFSIETLDNTTGKSSINSHFEIDYGSNLSRVRINFPTSDVQFISGQYLYFGDTFSQAWIVHNGTSGDLELKSNADVMIQSTQLDINGKNIVNVADIFSNASESIDLKSGTAIRLMPNSQTSRILLFSDGGNDGSINITFNGGAIIRVMPNELLTLAQNTSDAPCNSASAGAVIYSSNKHYGCNSTSWNALY